MLDPMWNARTQPRRLLTFALGGDAQLPPAPPRLEIIPVSDPAFKPNAKAEQGGANAFGLLCVACHGSDAVAGGSAPDLRASPVILSANAFRGIVKSGALLERGMPRFEELSDVEVENIRQYLRSRAMDLAEKKPPRNLDAPISQIDLRGNRPSSFCEYRSRTGQERNRRLPNGDVISKMARGD
jgi:quinohemoprotein ethanol dehydrogenase